MTSYARERELAAELARQAAARILVHRRPDVAFEEKSGGEGPVTAADREADAFIRERLQAAFPGDGLLTEETPDDGTWRQSSRVWMVDPLDGTKEFIAGREEFATMIGLCVDGEPVVGAVYQPLGDVLYTAAKGEGALLVRAGVSSPLRVGEGVPSPLPVAVSRSHRSKRLSAILAGLAPVQEVQAGSVGLKIGMIAAGTVRAYLNATCRTSLWDTCAPLAVLREAGGVLTDVYGRPLSYRAQVHHPHGLFGATGAVHAHLRTRLRETAVGVSLALAQSGEYPAGAFRPLDAVTTAP